MPTTWDALAILVLFLVPGFIGDRLLSASIIRVKRDAAETVLSVVLWSVVNYTLCLPVVWLALTQQFPKYGYLGLVLPGVFVLLVAPVLEALSLTKVVGPSKIARIYRAFGLTVHPIPRSWDYVFSRGISYFVLVTLTDGNRIGGLWGSNSFASSYPVDDEDLYLEQLWRLGQDGEFEEPFPLSAGALVRRSDIRYMEFFTIDDKMGV